MKVIVKTKGNYKNANNIPLKVVEFHSTRVSVEVPLYGFNLLKEPVGQFVTTDFNLKEVVGIYSWDENLPKNN
jgi:hypothetical protein